jgi:hypothetical protein
MIRDERSSGPPLRRLQPRSGSAGERGRGGRVGLKRAAGRARCSGGATKNVLVVVAVALLLGGLGWYVGLERPAREARRRSAAEATAREATRARAEQERLAQEKNRQEAALKQLALEQAKLEAARKEAERSALAKLRGGITIKSRPTGANVILGEDFIGQCPDTFLGLKIGKQAVSVELPGYEPARQEVEIKPDEVLDLGTVALVRLVGSVRIESEPPGAKVKEADRELGTTPLDLADLAPGQVSFKLTLLGFKPAALSGVVKPKQALKLQVKLEPIPFPRPGDPWENTLGMRFVPVPGAQPLFNICETRVQDFAAFAAAARFDANAGMYSLGAEGWKQRGDWWKSPGFEQGPAHPVCGVSWRDAKAFCAWLTEKEQREGKLGPKQKYRLPTDAEWSLAVGLGREPGPSPQEMSGVIRGAYPWGTRWPPPDKAGNYAGEESRTPATPPNWSVIAQYRDGYAQTAPVGSFNANRFGLHDLGGNVWEWCEDEYDAGRTYFVVRGGSWSDDEPETLLSSYRYRFPPDYRISNLGFRTVIDTPAP